MSFSINYHELLGVSRSSSTSQILSEYKIRALQLHPDKSSSINALDRFQPIQAAKIILCDQAQREAYDKWLDSGLNISFNDWIRYKNMIGTTMHWATKKSPDLMLDGSIGKKRVKDDDDYFNEEEEPRVNNLEYIPAPNSPSAKIINDGVTSDGSEDPLDAYMNEIDNELKKQKGVDKKQKQKGMRENLEREDEIESYIKFMEMNPHVGSYGDEDDVHYELDDKEVITTSVMSIF